VPHAPQLRASLERSKQEPPQFVCPPGQLPLWPCPGQAPAAPTSVQRLERLVPLKQQSAAIWPEQQSPSDAQGAFKATQAPQKPSASHAAPLQQAPVPVCWHSEPSGTQSQRLFSSQYPRQHEALAQDSP
jgi:hypothetical protein